MDFLRLTEVARDRVNSHNAAFEPEPETSINSSVIINTLLKPLGIKYALCKFEDLGIECIQIDDDFIKYVYLNGSHHLWADIKNEDSINPDMVLKYFLKKYKGIDISINSDRTVMLKKAGGK